MRLGRTLTIALLATLLGMFPAAISPLSADGLLEGCTIYDADDANLIESAKQRVAERNAQIAGGEGYLAKTCFDSWGYLYRFAFIERVRTVAFGVCVFAEREPYNVSPGTFGGECIFANARNRRRYP